MDVQILEDGGYRYTLVDGQLSSIDGEPAVVYPNGTKFWYRAGKLHREGDLPAVVYPNGVEEWWQDHQRHRDDGPAVVYPDAGEVVPELRGTKQHWRNGVALHEELPSHVAAYRHQLRLLRVQHFGEEQ